MAKQKKPAPKLGTDQLSPELIAMMYGANNKNTCTINSLIA